MVNNERDPEEIEKDKEVKRALVAETIASHAADLVTQFDDFKTISSALASGDELIVKAISGGCTNFSYKVTLRDAPGDVALFAKLSFAYALWNPDPDVHYSLERTENEFASMKMVSEMIDDAPVATPYLCVGVQEMKLLVTEWSKADEQWANQFIDGTVDPRVVPKLSQTLAVLHCADFDPEFNTNVRPCMTTLFPAMKEKLEELSSLPTGEGGRVADLARSYGKAICSEIVDKNLSNYNDRDCLVHSDAHAFNTLVESKPDVSTLERFGPNTDVILCDWEMVFAGPIGRDIGLAWSWPVSCLMAHAINGHAFSIDDAFLEIIDMLWDEYAKVLTRRGKDEAFLCKTYRNCIAWCGWFGFLAHYILGAQTEFLPIDDAASEEDKAALFDAIGVVGLKFLHLGYIDEEGDEDLSTEDMRGIFRGILLKEIEELDEMAAAKRKRVMRMSVLRTTGRRVSDASLHFSLNRKKMDVQFRGSLLEIIAD